MAFEEETGGENIKGKTSSKSLDMTLQKAIDLGEYNPEYLSTFPEWHTLSRHMKFQFIKEGLGNRERQLVVQWAEINNMLDFRLKPHLKEALENIQKQLKKVSRDREKLYLEYSK